MGTFATVAAAVASVVALGACGSGPRFDAEGFVDEANSHGAGLKLGAPLDSSQADTELYEVSIEGGGGTLTVLDTEEDAEAEHARCDRAGLFCYRAANVVLLFEPDTTPEALAKVAAAFKAMQE